MSKLLRCPLCGATAHRGPGKLRHDQLHGEPLQDYSFWCPKRHVVVVAATEELARVEWNTRAPQPPAGAPSAPEPVVKPLEWEELEENRGDGQTEVRGWEAANGFGLYYHIHVNSDHFQVEIDYEVLGHLETPDEAKSVAQDHHNKRVLAAVAVAPARSAATSAEPVAWRSKSLSEPWHYTADRLHDDDTARNEVGFVERPLYAAPTTSPDPTATGSELQRLCLSNQLVMLGALYEITDYKLQRLRLTQQIEDTRTILDSWKDTTHPRHDRVAP